MAQKFEVQIQQLAQAGLATHLVLNAPDVDRVFTVARAKDMPGVQFAAAFADGALAVGCPDGLPDVLVDIAEPIVVGADAVMSATHPKPGNVNEKIALLAQRIAENMPQSDDGAGVPAQLDRLQSAMRELANNTQGDVLQDIDRKLDALIAQRAQTSNDAGLSNDETAQLGDVLAQLEDMTEAPKEGSNHAEIMDQIAGIQASIVALVERADAGTGTTTDALSGLEDRLIAAIDARLAFQEPSAELVQITEGQTKLQSALSDLSAKVAIPSAPAVDLTQQRQSFAQFATVLSTMMQRVEARLDATSEPTLQEPEQDFAALIGDLRDDIVRQQAHSMADLRDQLAAVARGPAPVLDLTAQRQSFAVFTAALAQVVARLETTADEMIAALPASPDMVSNMLQDEIVTLRTVQEAGFAGLREDLSAAKEQGMSEFDFSVIEGNLLAYGESFTAALSEFRQMKDQIEGLLFDDAPVDDNDPIQEQRRDDFATLNDATSQEFSTEERQLIAPAEHAQRPLSAFPADAQAAFEDLKMDFAEMIAAQIRSSATSDSKTA